MTAVNDSTALGRSRLSFASQADIDEFVHTLEKFERGELTPDQWRAFRLVRGTYGQRQAEDAQMLRVKIPQGILTAEQLGALADVGDAYSRGFGHITTRQNIQFHFIKLHDAEPAMRRLAQAGLTTREACGNSVRNITACVYAGVAADEVFDVTPYAEAMTRYLLRHRLSASLPRKFKIAFEGCSQDHAQLPIHDLGFRAVIQVVGGVSRHGFRVLAGGGTAILCSSAPILFDFIPAEQILNVAEAVLRVFHGLGDFKHKQRNRMKFLIRELGWERWREAFAEALVKFQGEGGAALPFDPEDAPCEEPPSWNHPDAPSPAETTSRVVASVVRGPGIVPEIKPFTPEMNGDFSHWRRTNVRPQRQPGYLIVTTTVVLGDLTAQQMRVLGDLALAYGDGMVRIASEQDLVFRWVRQDNLQALYRRLAAAGLALPDANTVADVVSCPGAESCRLAVTASRGLGRLLGDFLRSRPDLVESAPDLQIKMSGCPNGCGRHHIAGIGFQGSVRKLGDKVLPQYFVMLGGAVSDTGATFARLAAKIPARRIPQAVERLIGLYTAEKRDGETATAFFERLELDRAKALLADLERMRPEDATPTDFIDLGEISEFKVETMDGECSA